MNKALRNWAAALIGIAAGPIISAGAQQGDFGSRWPRDPTPPAQNTPPAPAQQAPSAAQPSAKPAPAARPAASTPAIAGTWSGQVTQVGSEAKLNIVLTLTTAGGETNYPELNCGGKLTRIGASHGYVFFVEVITRGQAEKGGRCPDGTITVARAGDNLSWVWFGAPQGDVIMAFGSLARKTGR